MVDQGAAATIDIGPVLAYSPLKTLCRQGFRVPESAYRVILSFGFSID
jgi:hypothetical protein